MKIKGKILSLFSLLSISFSALAIDDGIRCPDLAFLNQNAASFHDGIRISIPSIGANVRVEFFIDEIPGIARFTSFESASLNDSIFPFVCTYKAIASNGDPDQKVFLQSNIKGLKPVDPLLWSIQNTCIISPVVCQVTNH